MRLSRPCTSLGRPLARPLGPDSRNAQMCDCSPRLPGEPVALCSRRYSLQLSNSQRPPALTYKKSLVFGEIARDGFSSGVSSRGDPTARRARLFDLAIEARLFNSDL